MQLTTVSTCVQPGSVTVDFGDEDDDEMWRMETRARVGNMKIDELKASLKEKGLQVSGSKSDLIRRY